MRAEAAADPAVQVRVLVVDDEPPARATLRSLLAADPEVVLVGECGSGPEAVASMERERPDVVFLDVQMPGMSGFGVLDHAAAGAPAVVFVTAHSDHALRAFDVHAVDYLLKPFDDDRFALALERAKAAVRQERVAALAGRLAALVGDRGAARADAPRRLEHIAVRTADGIRAVPVAEVDWIGAQDYYAEVHAGGKSWLVREPLRDLERRLDPERFVRVHRRAIVNVGRVRLLRDDGQAPSVVLEDGTVIPVSRAHRRALRARIAAP